MGPTSFVLDLDIEGIPLPDVATREAAGKLDSGLPHGVEAGEDVLLLLLLLKLGVDDEQHVLDTVVRQRSFESLETAVCISRCLRAGCFCHSCPAARRPTGAVGARVCSSGRWGEV